ncbi:MAG: hypothetical protein LBU50_02690 [Cellulomonas sp.]|jgi:hypothetical protein|nr:hypothetical protein [Cellulomonas sp.]
MRLTLISGSHRTSRRLCLGVVVLAAGLALAGCSGPDGRYLTNAVDVERATRMWNDPWAAPADTSAASGRADIFIVDRGVAYRKYRTAVSPRDAVLGEIQAAQAVGWELTGVSCGPKGTKVNASLKRSGSLDKAAAGWVGADKRAVDVVPQATPTPPGTAGPGNPSPDPAPFTVAVGVQVPHHLDREWPDPPAVAVEDTCLAGTVPGVAAQVYQYSHPLLAGNRLPGKATTPSYGAQKMPDGVLDIADDPVLTRLGLDLRSRTGRTGDPPSSTSPPQATVATTLSDTLTQATAEGWSLTYTGCWASGMTVAELHRDLTSGHTAALRLQQTPNSADDPTQVAFTAAAVIASARRGGPGPDDLNTVTTPCWAQEPTDPTTPAFTWAGTPWFGPTRLDTIQP